MSDYFNLKDKFLNQQNVWTWKPEEQKEKGMEICCEDLENIDRQSDWLENVITCDETCIFFMILKLGAIHALE